MSIETQIYLLYKGFSYTYTIGFIVTPYNKAIIQLLALLQFTLLLPSLYFTSLEFTLEKSNYLFNRYSSYNLILLISNLRVIELLLLYSRVVLQIITLSLVFLAKLLLDSIRPSVHSLYYINFSTIITSTTFLYSTLPIVNN